MPGATCRRAGHFFVSDLVLKKLPYNLLTTNPFVTTPRSARSRT